jgi:hypothetical protein
MRLMLVVLCVSAGIAGTSAGGFAAEFEVSTIADDGYGSLRQAILDANDNPGRDRIRFNIPGDGIHTIRVTNAWPEISESLEIDGYTQPGSRPNTAPLGFNGIIRIEVQRRGLWLSGSGFSVVRGLSINDALGDGGIVLNSPSNVIVGNFIGLRPDGLTHKPNAYGIATGPSNSSGVLIGGRDPMDRNVIAGQVGNGLRVDDYSAPGGGRLAARDIWVFGNYFGTDASGLKPLPSNAIASSFSIRALNGFVLGGMEPGEGNVIAPGLNGVHVYAGVTGTRILGNSIGVGADGRTPFLRTNAATGITAPEGTLIAGNRIAHGSVGIVASSRSVTISENSIFSNSFRGILGLATNTPTLQVFRTTNQLIIHGELRAAPEAVFQIELFTSLGGTTTNLAQGEFFLGGLDVTTSPAGVVSFERAYPIPDRVFDGVTATSTDVAGTTSEFSPGAQARSATELYIHAHPVGALVTAGGGFSFSADISGAPPIHYQWRHNGEDVAGATNAILHLANIEPPDQGEYQLIAWNVLGSIVTLPATLSVESPPVFIHHPASQVVAPGEWVTLSAALRDFTTAPVGFRWRSNSIFVSSSVGSATATFMRYQAGTNAVSWSVVATNPLSRFAVISGTATINVAADRDEDGLPDLYETLWGLNVDDPADAGMDADGDGVLTRDEYLSGTNPRETESRLRIDSLSWSVGGKARLQFAASSNKTYRVEYRDEFTSGEKVETPGTNAWQILTAVPARRTNGPIVLTDPIPPSAPHRFYRLVTPYLP